MKKTYTSPVEREIALCSEQLLVSYSSKTQAAGDGDAVVLSREDSGSSFWDEEK